MPKIIIRADAPGDEVALITLSERLVADNLESGHYAAQLIERLGWAVRDAQTLEAAQSSVPASPSLTGSRSDRQAWKPPIMSVASSPSRRSAAAARLEA